MSIIWHYLDKRGAAINALKDYSSMQYIIHRMGECPRRLLLEQRRGLQSRPRSGHRHRQAGDRGAYA